MKTALFVSTCLMATFFAVAAPIQALGGTGDAGKIAFESNQHDPFGLNEVYRMNADGTGATRLTTGAGSPFWGRYRIDPAVSPDGTKIAFVGTSDADGSELWTMNFDGSGLTRITSTPSTLAEESPSWSPDGRRIVFSRSDGRFRSNPELFVVNADGTGLLQLTDNGEFEQYANREPDWLADGRIAFISDRSGPDYDLYVMESSGGEATQLTSDEGSAFDPDGSPDGSRIAFTQSGPADPADIHVINANGTGRARLTTNPARDERVSWSPDGSKLAFDSDRPGFTVQVFTMNADGSNVELISMFGSDNRAPSWGPADVPVPVDTTAPTIEVRSPVDAATYRLHESVAADYACADEPGGSGVATCIGPVPNGAPVDTSTAGTFSFPVTAVDGAGNSTTAEVSYKVERPDTTPPTITITSPEDGVTYQLFDQLAVQYECADEVGGSGVVYCEGDLPNGDRVDTGTPGIHQFAVLAQDGAGNEASATVTYDVVDTSPPKIHVAAPVDGATYDYGESVVANYDCVDPGGVASCVGPVASGAAIDTASSGQKTFTVAATDQAGNTDSATVRYTVGPPPPADTVPPTLSLPADMTVEATGPGGATVTYVVSATDDVDPTPSVACSPEAGSVFLVGTTTVTCTATDAAGNRAHGSFRATVARRATVVIPIQGIDPMPNYTDARTKDPWTALAAADVFGPLLSALGCANPIPTVRATTLACARPDLYWAAYSYAGVDSAGVAQLFRGADTHQPLATSAAHLQDLVNAVRRERGQGTNVVVVGFSLGGTVAARWASTYRATDVPVVTIASPVYGMWPDARNTGLAEDVGWYCNPFTAGDLAKPFADDALFQTLCLSWSAGRIPLGPLGFIVGGYRSAASYDWRTGVVTGPIGVRDLLLLNVGNRRDMVAPVFWEVSPDAAAVRLAHCTGDQGHGCVKAHSAVLAAIARVVDVTKGAALSAQRPSRALVVSRFKEGATPDESQPAQLSGYAVDVRAGGAWRITAIGERVVTYGASGADDRAEVRCVTGASVTRLSPSRVRIRWPDWQPHALVVRFRFGVLPVDFQATARVVPADDAPDNTYSLVLGPLPGGSAGACPIP